jgi:nucleotide-binding universal stress UspA family protein
MYNTILVPLDGSDRSTQILPHVQALAEKFGSRLVLLQVVEPTSVAMMPSTDAIPYFDPDLLARIIEEAKTYLVQRQVELKAQGIEAVTYIETGPVVSTILATAEREHADLIAMGSHGRTGLARVFYGSVATGVLNQADRPLLLVRTHS